MKFIADFHIHSKYSRATSALMNLENLDKWAQIKGIRVLGSGDFTHPEWFKEIKKELEPDPEGTSTGLFKLRGQNSPIRFILTSEISCIYTKAGPRGNSTKKIHIIIFAPSIDTVEKINKKLGEIGNLKADGRPILGLNAKDLVEIVLGVNENCLIVPAHAWTPWFSVFGSKSGFNSLEECFEEYTKHIYAIETGLSSDPAMNWRLSQLDKIALISNSDSHSPQKIGREANVFDTEMNYQAVIGAIKSRDKNKFLYTIEFFPEEGKYHYDGHRLCNLSLKPQESKKYNNICPRCGKPLIIGVLNRVEELADRSEGFIPPNIVPFKRLVPLQEIIAEALGVSVLSKEVLKQYDNLIKKLGPELYVLLEATEKEIKENSGVPLASEIAEGVIRVREGRVFIEPGYDGVYGKVKIFSEGEVKHQIKQKTLF
jgi:uncharacterized protein (TIGR00375 family)